MYRKHQTDSAELRLQLKIEEELHDARRVQTYGQEEDLRLALNMIINRVTELSSMLTEAHKKQADLEVQLNVAKSNLALVIANNEMLEDALKRDNSTNSRDVGWRKRSGKDNDVSGERRSLEEWQQVPAPETGSSESLPNSPVNSPQISNQLASSGNVDANAAQASRFFKFRFASGSSSSRPTTRPSTPSGTLSATMSPQITSQPSATPVPTHVTKELEELGSELEKERSARKAAEKDKASLEAELESLSQALFEEANKMVAVERIKLAETEEELKQLQAEKDALKGALCLIEGENTTLRESSVRAKSASTPNLLSLEQHHDQPVFRFNQDSVPEGDRNTQSPIKVSRSRSSSEVAIKSRPSSVTLESTAPFPPSLVPESESSYVGGDNRAIAADGPSPLPVRTIVSSESADSQTTPKGPLLQPLPHPSSLSDSNPPEQSTPWIDIPSQTRSKPGSPASSTSMSSPNAIYGAAPAMP